MMNETNVDLEKISSCYTAATQSMESLLSLHRNTSMTSTKMVNIDVHLSSMFSKINDLEAFTIRLLFLLHVAFQKMTGKNYSCLLYTS